MIWQRDGGQREDRLGKTLVSTYREEITYSLTLSDLRSTPNNPEHTRPETVKRR